MSARDDLSRATGEAREQVRAARAALAGSRAERGGGPAKDVAQAEAQLQGLRDAVTDDLRVLRDRVTGMDDRDRRGATLAAVTGAGSLAVLVGTGLAVRGRVRRTLARREVQQQARAIATAMARQAADAMASTDAPRSGGRRGGLLSVLAIGAAVTGFVIEQRRRTAPVDPDDLWLPERTPDEG